MRDNTIKMKQRQFAKGLLISSIVLALAACGGGSGGDTTTAATSPTTPSDTVPSVGNTSPSTNTVPAQNIQATFNRPDGVAVGADGTVYVADTLNNMIRKITPAGVVTSLGTAGVTGYLNTGESANGVNGPLFNNPTGLAVDSGGNIYVADSNNNMIRKITPTGVVSTVAGFNSRALTTNTSLGVLAGGFADSGDVNGPLFAIPTGVAVDNSGNVYVADSGNNAIREITPSSTDASGYHVTTIAGGTQGSADAVGRAAQFHTPYGIALDSSRNLYVTDSLNNTIRKLTQDPVSRLYTVTTLAGTANTFGGFTNGTGAAASFGFPEGITVDSKDNVYVTSSPNTIRKITPAGVVTNFAGYPMNGSVNGSGSVAEFYLPNGLAIDGNDNIYVADTWNNLIRKVSPAAVVSTFAGIAGVTGSANP